MLINLENEQYKVIISSAGAELCKIQNKHDGFEYLWDDVGRGYWKWQAPILFPSIGRSNQDKYMIDQQLYSMPQHGFIRDQNFSVIENDTDYAKLKFSENNLTTKLYPFKFDFIVRYDLTDTGLVTTYAIYNDGSTDLPYAIGSHPGFNLESDLSNYNLILNFEHPVHKLKRFVMDSESFINGDVADFNNDHVNIVPLSHKLLDDGSITFANNEIISVMLSSSLSKHNIKLSLDDFPYFTIWSPENKNAPFICIEPFAGLPDKVGQPVDIYEKWGNSVLPVHENKVYQYALTLN